MNDAPDHEMPERHDGQHQEIQINVALEVDDAEKAPARHALNAVLAMREGSLEAQEIEHLRQGERDHREIDALAADGEEADGQSEPRGRERPGEDGEIRLQGPPLL